MKILLELRAALDGHSGIPQETRLLFRGLAGMEGVEVVGMIQSSNLVVEPGLPVSKGDLVPNHSPETAIDQLSRVVVSLQQGPASHRFEHVRKRALGFLGPLSAAVASLFGRKVPLGGFDPTHFKDFVWRAMFAKSLPHSDFETVTSRAFRVLRWPWSMLHAVGVVSGWMGRALYARLDTTGIDVMVVETPFPGRVSGRTRMVVRYHDAIPLLMPHTIKDRSYHRATHYRALCRNAKDGAWFACVSESTRQDLLSVMPQLAPRAVTIPNMVSHHFYAEPSSASRVPEIIWSRKNRRAPHEGGAEVSAADIVDGALPYLLMVSTIEPRKNHLALLEAWELLRSEGESRLNLVIVGSPGWGHEVILQRFSPWLHRGGLHMLEGVPADDLRLLYRHAQVTVCPSFGEGFDFPGVEAMCCGGVVAASDIPVHRGVFGQACDYFSPYSTTDIARSLRSLMGPDAQARREQLVQEGAVVSAQYLPEKVLPQWREFLARVAA
ncbi:glycosyltransferase family 4 protein [Sphaerotilaceae bacterium SBD11-9]